MAGVSMHNIGLGLMAIVKVEIVKLKTLKSENIIAKKGRKCHQKSQQFHHKVTLKEGNLEKGLSQNFVERILVNIFAHPPERSDILDGDQLCSVHNESVENRIQLNQFKVARFFATTIRLLLFSGLDSDDFFHLKQAAIS